MSRLADFGWRGESAPGIGRVTSSHGDYFKIVCDESTQPVLARKKKSAFAGKSTKAKTFSSGLIEQVVAGEDSAVKPVTGDFVRFIYNPGGESMITSVLPRFSAFERKDPAARRKSQILAVNFDTLFIMMSVTGNFSLPRLSRYLALSGSMGRAQAVVVLTKTDLAPGDAQNRVREAESLGCRAIGISVATGDGLDALSPYFAKGETVAFVGSSGVGKSTLLNHLAGEILQDTQEIQEWSGKGRHTTTVRELFLLPSGALALDTPGVREIGIVGETDILRAKGESTHRWRK